MQEKRAFKKKYSLNGISLADAQSGGGKILTIGQKAHIDILTTNRPKYDTYEDWRRATFDTDLVKHKMNYAREITELEFGIQRQDNFNKGIKKTGHFMLLVGSAAAESVISIVSGLWIVGPLLEPQVPYRYPTEM